MELVCLACSSRNVELVTKSFPQDRPNEHFVACNAPGEGGDVFHPCGWIRGFITMEELEDILKEMKAWQ